LTIRLTTGDAKMKKILVIDDEVMILETMKIIFEDMGVAVETHSDSRKGLAAALEGEYDLVLVDIRMPEMNGAEVAEELLAAKPGTKLFVITAYPNDPLVARALAAGAIGLLKKPFEIAKIMDFLKD
jgi:CheY-like chemotaxis protein